MNVELAAGIDVSHYKKQIDWEKVKRSGVLFAFIKATEADHFVDSRFDYNWTRSRRAGIIRGAYHFFRPVVDPVAQANHFLKVVGDILHETDLPPVLDVEAYPKFVAQEFKQISKEERLQRIEAWLKTVEQVVGRPPIIYTEFYTWHDYMDNSARFARHPLWIANYRVDQPRVPAGDWGGNGWMFWQTTERGVVPGIRDGAPCVDLDLYRGSLADLQDWLGIESERALPPDVTNGDMMAAIVDAAEKTGGQAGDWANRAGLNYLVNPVGNSLRPYNGPAVDDLNLAETEKAALAEALKDYSGTNSSSWSITHQDLINAFYYAASLEDLGGWSLVERAGIGYIGKERDVLYSGPVIAELPGLTPNQKEAIQAYLGVPDVVYEEEEYVVPAPHLEPEEEAVELEVEPEDAADEAVTPTYSETMNNQAVINAFYLTAIKLDRNGEEILAAAGLVHLADNRLQVYSGPKIEDLPGLSNRKRKMIAELLGVPLPQEQADATGQEAEPAAVGPEAPQEAETEGGAAEAVEPVEAEVEEVEDLEEFLEVEPAVEDEAAESPKVDSEAEGAEETESGPTYFGLLNQDIIDLFYRAAALFGESGLDWLIKVGLAYLDKDRQTRYKMYQGPIIEQIKGLSQEEQQALAKTLRHYRQQ